MKFTSWKTKNRGKVNAHQGYLFSKPLPLVELEKLLIASVHS